jgi:hypothetical protein
MAISNATIGLVPGQKSIQLKQPKLLNHESQDKKTDTQEEKGCSRNFHPHTFLRLSLH